MRVVAMMGQGDIWIDALLQLFEQLLQAPVFGREEAVPHVMDRDLACAGRRKKTVGACARFTLALVRRRKDDPVDTRLRILTEQGKDGAARTNLDVICVRAKT